MSKQELLRPARVTVLARRVSSAGIVVITVLALAIGVIIERSILPASAVRHPTVESTPAEATTRPAVRKTRRRKRVRTIALAVLDRNVQAVTMSKLGAEAKRSYGSSPTAKPSVSLSHTNAAHTWAVGTSAIPVPAGDQALPEVTLFVAYVANGTWQVALAGQPGFDTAVQQAPTTVMPAAEKGVLIASQNATTVTNTDLMLPWRMGQAWTMNSAPGGLSFSGGSGRVLAAGPGYLYHACRQGAQSLIVIIHPNGLTTVYDQLTDTTTARNGSYVTAGTFLGKTGTRLACGGGTVAGKPALRFALQDGMLDGTTIGGWTFHVDVLSGFAQHGASIVKPGGKLQNFGSPVMPTTPPATPAPSPSEILPTALPSIGVPTP